MPTPLHLTVVVPAYDELPNLRKLLPAAHGVLSEMPDVDATIITVVRGATSDEDMAELTALGARPVRRTPTDSFGDAIRSGIASCDPSTNVVIFMDADGSHDPVTIPRLVAEHDSADIVIASRYVEGGRSDNSFALRTMSRTLNIVYGLVLGIRCRDISTNYKLFRYSDIAGIELTCTNFDIVEELLFRVRQRVGPELTIVEIPDYFHERDEGETKRALGPFVVSYVATLMRLRRSK